MGQIRTLGNQRVTTCIALAMIALAGCGSGGDDGGSPSSQAPATLSGTVAAGAAISGVDVSIRDRTGAPACVEMQIVTAASGAYICTLAANAAPPFAILVTDPNRLHAPLASVAPAAPAPGQSSTANVSPLTTGVLGLLAADGNPFTLIGDAAAYGALSAQQLRTFSAPVVQQLAVLLQAAGLSGQEAAAFDPFTTPFAADHAGVDAVLDQIRVEFASEPVNNKLVTTIINVADPNAAPVPLAAPNEVATPLAVVTPPYGASDLEVTRQALESCFAVPLAQRVLGTDDGVPLHEGGPVITATHPTCENLARADFRNNGYSAAQYFYASLTDPDMDGAQFAAPVVMRVLPDDTDGNARVLLNLRFLNRLGFANSFILVMKRFPGTATAARPSDWWLWGNQRDVHTHVRAYILRRQQFADLIRLPNATPSRYEVGLEIFINKGGPGSRNTGGEALRAVRVSGPGLPQAGLVYAAPDPSICTEQTWMAISNKDGDINVSSSPRTDNLFAMRRARLDGSVYPNPNEANINRNQFPNWAHPLDYAGGQLPSISSIGAWQTYAFELFYGSETTPSVQFETLNATPLRAPTLGTSLPWNVMTPATRQYLDPGHAKAVATSQFDLAWAQNSLGEYVRSVGVYTASSAGAGPVAVIKGLTLVASPGATSVTVTAPTAAACAAGTQFGTLAGDGSGWRIFQLRYQMLDGSYRDSREMFN
jgi:hypothetical protein